MLGLCGTSYGCNVRLTAQAGWLTGCLCNPTNLEIPHKSLCAKPQLLSNCMHFLLVLMEFVLVGQVAELWLLSDQGYKPDFQLLLLGYHLSDFLTHTLC